MTPEGTGLARRPGDGRVVFVPYAAPGDLAEVRLGEVKKGFARAELQRVIEPGPARIEPPCPLHFRPGGGAPCGGCDWQQLAYDEQLRSKRDLVRDALRRIARLPDVPVEPALPSPAQWRYRNKVQVPVARGEAGALAAGFYAPGSHRIIPFEDCPVQPEVSVRVLAAVRRLGAGSGWKPYDERTGEGWLRHILVRTNQEGKALLTLVSKTAGIAGRDRFLAGLAERAPEVCGAWQNVQPAKTSVILGPEWRHLAGERRLVERLGGLRIAVSPGSFLQVNTPACEQLYGVVSDYLAQGGGARPPGEGAQPLGGRRWTLAVDLYSGVGSIALWIAPLADRVLGVEENRGAVEDAWDNARLNGVRNARFLAGAVETSLGRLRRELDSIPGRGAAAILDPPRAGASPAVLRALGAPAFGRVVYVSCDPATFARDSATLTRSGYALRRVQPVDLFPQTSHVECVGLFERV